MGERGNRMREEYLFWKLAQYFIKDENYRVLHINNEQNELWLENSDSKQAPTIRLLKHDLDWSRWMERDIQLTALNGENIRKQMYLKNIQILNIYISPYPPVDDYDEYINKTKQFDNTLIQSFILSKTTYQEAISILESKFKNIHLLPLDNEVDYSIVEIQKLKEDCLRISSKRVQDERRLFSYGRPIITYIFIAIQVIMFILLEMNGGSENSSTLVEFGAKFNPLIITGEWWRFITPIFLHIGFMHLLMNTLGLYYLGMAVEKIYGSLRFFWIYLFAGIIGCIASFTFSANLSAGASGAIYGCFGALLYIWLIYPKLFFKTLGRNLITILVLNIVISITIPGIDLAGHLGGLVGGFIATGIVHFPKKKKPVTQVTFLLLGMALTAALLFFGYNRPIQFQSEESIIGLAQEYLKEENYQETYTLLNNYLNDKNEASAPFYFQLSYVEIKMGKMDEAKSHLEKVIEMDPDFDEAHFNLALILLEQGKTEEANKHIKKAAEIDPSNKNYQDVLEQLN
jgi:rhomboid protease GluP